MFSRARSFVLGAFLGVVFGATVLGAVAHLVLIGVALAGLGVAAYHGRRLVPRRAGAEKRLKA